MILLTILSYLAFSYEVPNTISQSERLLVESHYASLYQRSRLSRSAKGTIKLSATTAIKHGDTILSIPFSDLITSFDHFPWTPTFYQENHHTKLTLRLIYEKFVNPLRDLKSLTVHYLPTSLDNYFNLTQEEKDYMSSLIFREKYSVSIDCERGYEEVYVRLMEADVIKQCSECRKKDAWMWSCIIVTNDAFSIDKEIWAKYHKINLGQGEKENGAAIITALGILKHMPKDLKLQKGYKKNLFELNEAEMTLNVNSHYNIESGKEIYYNFGEKRNLDLLFSYGFIIKNNPEDYFVLKAPGVQGLCKSYDSKNELCVFHMNSLSLNNDFANYVAKRLKYELLIINFEEYQNKALKPLQLKQSISVALNYRKGLQTGDKERCTKDLKEITVKIESNSTSNPRLAMIDLSCQELNKLHYRHLKRIDRLSISLLFKYFQS